jgi:hypothetical protein
MKRSKATVPAKAQREAMPAKRKGALTFDRSVELQEKLESFMDLGSDREDFLSLVEAVLDLSIDSLSPG